MFSFVVLLSSCAALSMAQYGQYPAPLPQAPLPPPPPMHIFVPRPVPQQPYPQPELLPRIPPQPITQEPSYPGPQLPQVPPQPVLLPQPVPQPYSRPQILTQDPPMTIQPRPEFIPEVIPQQPEPVLPEPDCEDGNGFYVLGCSSIYWRCVEGRMFKTQCASGLKFNPETRSCQYTDEVPLCNVGMDTNTENFVKVEEEVWTPEPESVKPLPTPDCENGNGYYVFGCNTKYWRCDNGRLFDLECGNGLKFNPETRECQYKEEVSLCTSGSESEMVKPEEEEIKTPQEVIVTVP